MRDNDTHSRPTTRRTFLKGTAAGALATGVSLDGAAAAEQTEDGVLGSPTLAVDDRLNDRRYVAAGTRAYVVGTQAGRFPAMGWHTRGEMGGVWSPPLKLLDGVWFGVDGEWFGPATRFESGYGYVSMDLPAPEGRDLSVRRIDFAPDGRRAAAFGLEFTAGDADESFALDVAAHSELLSAYPWGFTTPSAEEFNLEDSVAFDGDRLVFRERGTPPVENGRAHDWAAVVGTARSPASHETGESFRGPQDPATVCPAEGEAPERCDDTGFGKGKGGRLGYEVAVPANSTETVWFVVAGAEDGPESAHAEFDRVADDPRGLLESKVEGRMDLRERTRLDLPGDRRLQRSIDWSKQNLADSVQAARNLSLRDVEEGEAYPEPAGTVESVRFVGAGFPDYPWLFATDGEYTAFANVAVGQFEPIEDHLRALRDVSQILNDGSGKVVHEVVTTGDVYFGTNDDPGNVDETAKFPSAVALVWRWTGDDEFRDEMYDFARANMEYVVEETSEDGDVWPEGLGNVEREGMGEEKLDVSVYAIRGFYDLADMARSRGDGETAAWALRTADRMARRFEGAWWTPDVPQHADSLTGPNNRQVYQRHWISVTPMEVELTRDGERQFGLADESNGNAALDLRETECYSGVGDDADGEARRNEGLYHTGGPGCDPAESDRPPERSIFTLNTAVMAVGEGNYGRLGPDRQRRYLDANAKLQLPNPDEQPGAMPEIAPSPNYGRSIDLPFVERAMVLQAWGAYGTTWPVVHQHLGVRPDLGRGRLAVVPQVPPDVPRVAGENVRLGDGSVAVTASADGDAYRTTVRPDLELRALRVGHVLPADADPDAVTLDGESVEYETRRTHRGTEVVASVEEVGDEHELAITTVGGE